MITNDGKLHIKRYLAGQVPAIGRSIAFGVGAAAETVGDTRLQFETSRSDVMLTSYDFDTNKLVFKAILDANVSGTIYELGLFSREDAGPGAYGSRLVTTFDSGTESWFQASSPATFTTTNTRIGGDSVSLTPAASGTVTVSAGTYQDFSGHSASDRFVFAFNNGTANLSLLRYRFLTDANNHYDFNLTSSNYSTGYNVVSFTKGSATPTGSPDWGNITQIQVAASATSGGAVALNLDGIRVEDTDTISTDYVLVARKLLTTPFVKEAGRIQEVEFTLDVNI